MGSSDKMDMFCDTNSVPRTISSELYSFANGVEAFYSPMTLKLITLSENTQFLQNDLKLYVDYHPVKTKKSSDIHTSKARDESVYSAKELVLDTDIFVIFKNSIITKIKKFDAVLAIIKRSLPQKVLVKLYTALLRPHLIYAAELWNQRLTNLNSCAEKVQRSAGAKLVV